MKFSFSSYLTVFLFFYIDCPSSTWVQFQDSCYIFLQEAIKVESIEDVRNQCTNHGKEFILFFFFHRSVKNVQWFLKKKWFVVSYFFTFGPCNNFYSIICKTGSGMRVNSWVGSQLLENAAQSGVTRAVCIWCEYSVSGTVLKHLMHFHWF